MDRSEIIAECRERHGRREVSDECARSILRFHGGRNLSVLAFLIRGELPLDRKDPNGRVITSGETRLYRLVFARYSFMGEDDRLMGDMLGTWLVQHARTRVGDNWALAISRPFNPVPSPLPRCGVVYSVRVYLVEIGFFFGETSPVTSVTP